MVVQKKPFKASLILRMEQRFACHVAIDNNKSLYNLDTWRNDKDRKVHFSTILSDAKDMSEIEDMNDFE